MCVRVLPVCRVVRCDAVVLQDLSVHRHTDPLYISAELFRCTKVTITHLVKKTHANQHGFWILIGRRVLINILQCVCVCEISTLTCPHDGQNVRDGRESADAVDGLRVDRRAHLRQEAPRDDQDQETYTQ